MKLYLAGPMAGYAEHNYPTFKKVTSYLREAGHEVVCPTELNLDAYEKVEAGLITIEEAYYLSMPADIAAVAHCEGIAYLPHWENSRGATFEMMVAELLHKRFIDVRSIDPIIIREDYHPGTHIIRDCFMKRHLTGPPWDLSYDAPLGGG